MAAAALAGRDRDVSLGGKARELAEKHTSEELREMATSEAAAEARRNSAVFGVKHDLLLGMSPKPDYFRASRRHRRTFENSADVRRNQVVLIQFRWLGRLPGPGLIRSINYFHAEPALSRLVPFRLLD
ncbi:hypothetical protein [Bosea beijingensis]|uniref:hypothetical protein n=1 Tax=Bosea beijingensis TaxID=3068632 RepID=UPI0027408DE4|nr:hypothetical protein [Bosea sp. REN20]